MQREPDGGHERERDERGHGDRGGQQQHERDGGDGTATTQAACNPQPDRDVGEEVEGGAAAECNSRDPVQFGIDVRERRPQAERKQDDARDHGQVEIAVDVACDSGALHAASVAE